MPRLPLALALLVLAGCAASPDGAEPAALADVWAGLDDGAAALRASDVSQACAPYGSYFDDFGVRALACTAAQSVSPASVVARAPVAPFADGPHRATATGVRLDLDAGRAFGRYDPAFVDWVGRAAVPTGPAGALVAPIYRRHAARLARTYWLALADLDANGFPASTPRGPLAAYADYLDGAAVPAGMEAYDTADGFSVFAFSDRSERLVPAVQMPVDNEWTFKYEANTAYGFWLRRRADGTHDAWRAALLALLRAYDADWLAAR